ncbi:MAG: hypothetical protein DMF06_04955 [Verrucomicrobia bacterium]|nr:MAG: hypothetical protein DMF06_04955 [Verrucomicrobiota bacterium]
MSAAIRDAGSALRTIAGMQMRDAGGTMREIKSGQIRDATSALRIFYQSTTMLVTPVTDDLMASKWTSGASKTVSVTAPVLTIVGGQPPIIIAWSRVSGDIRIGVDNAAIANPTFSAMLDGDDEATGVWKGVITDAAGFSQTVTRNITLRLVFVDISGTA